MNDLGIKAVTANHREKNFVQNFSLLVVKYFSIFFIWGLLKMNKNAFLPIPLVNITKTTRKNKYLFFDESKIQDDGERLMKSF